MKLATPRWWYVREAAPAPVTRALLRPVSWIWAWATARRIARTAPVDPGVPVICVGNLTVGGAGKTPVVRELLARLRDRGTEAHGLSRGHFWIARDRAQGARAAAETGAQVVVMDDGHQNPSVRKALSVVVVDGETRDGEWPFGDGVVFPSGPMREPLKAGLARADAVVVLLPADLPAPDPALLALFSELPVLLARLEAAAPPPPGPQFGFAGVGKPWKVERALRAAGCELVDFAAWPVRARFEDEAALDALLARALP